MIGSVLLPSFGYRLNLSSCRLSGKKWETCYKMDYGPSYGPYFLGQAFSLISPQLLVMFHYSLIMIVLLVLFPWPTFWEERFTSHEWHLIWDEYDFTPEFTHFTSKIVCQVKQIQIQNPQREGDDPELTPSSLKNLNTIDNLTGNESFFWIELLWALDFHGFLHYLCFSTVIWIWKSLVLGDYLLPSVLCNILKVSRHHRLCWNNTVYLILHSVFIFTIKCLAPAHSLTSYREGYNVQQRSAFFRNTEMKVVDFKRHFVTDEWGRKRSNQQV